jgi:hypothetical protein
VWVTRNGIIGDINTWLQRPYAVSHLLWAFRPALRAPHWDGRPLLSALAFPSMVWSRNRGGNEDA